MILDDLVTYIASNSTVFTGGTNLFVGTMPTTPRTMVGIFEYGGFDPVWAFGGSAPVYERATIQILSRSTSYQTARNNSETIHTLMENVVNSTSVSSTGPRYLQIRAIQPPSFIGRNENNDPEVSCNYQVWKERS